MGLEAVRDMVWEVAMSSRVFRSTAFAKQVDDLRAHSTATAHLAKLVASRTAVANDYAFMAGLIHDIGAQMIFIVASEQIKPVPLPFLVAPVVRAQHEAASGTIAKLWKLPPDLQIVLAHHHTIVVGGLVHPLNAVLAVAESLARKLGAPGPEGTDDAAPETLLVELKRSLGLADPAMATIEAEAQKLLAKLATASAR
jgi:HD-like signal output (HDOD) protein